jgi:hypothetical protein
MQGDLIKSDQSVTRQDDLVELPFVVLTDDELSQVGEPKKALPGTAASENPPRLILTTRGLF